MRRLLAVVVWMCLGGVAAAQPVEPGAVVAPTAEALLDQMDKNLTFEARRARMVMTVEGRRTRTYEMISHGRGEEDSAMEYVAPARDKGTRMLKLGNELWLYLPGADRVQKISGHMLREGMMGSDVSYEDLMAARELRKRYAAKVLGEGTHDNRPCWTLELKAKDPAVTYPRRVSCIDKETFVPLKQDLYALSGMLLKTWTMSDVKTFADGRRFPTRMSVRDHVKQGSVTRVEFKELEFGIDSPQEVFSLRWLERR
ncbi:outer membrane lipoprotein-sorting protein [Corallococcus sp. ZKHCc1 1396]|uniref:Outer membrane lipoprotein-sorting protein n=1 Tax=Corallococcus soli TaxID=2710757 RepID=A0ABR9PSG0_9BACT|nr:outer membrane lipoprotein-sorting protein [Corallococcus soli]MBE4750867.1 outer membrane lipoprotein-sorting protein [Corallococcus soli]